MVPLFHASPHPISSVVFAGFTIVTDSQTKQLTDHTTPIGSIYVVLHCSLMKNNIPVNCQACYGDGAGNTVEENSSVFSIILMRSCLQCFDTVGWWQEGHLACKNMGVWWRLALASLDGVVPRSSLLALTHPGGPGKRAVKCL